MSYEATIMAAGGNEATMAKSFVIIARDIAQRTTQEAKPLDWVK